MYEPVDVMSGVVDEDDLLNQLEDRLKKKYGSAY